MQSSVLWANLTVAILPTPFPSGNSYYNLQPSAPNGPGARIETENIYEELERRRWSRGAAQSSELRIVVSIMEIFQPCSSFKLQLRVETHCDTMFVLKLNLV